MRRPTVIYSQADVARALGVSGAAVANYFQRYGDTPRPAYLTSGGLRFWDARGFAAWQAWRERTITPRKQVAP